MIFILGGTTVNSIYRELEYENEEGEIITISVRIDNEFFILTNVFYCPRIK